MKIPPHGRAMETVLADLAAMGQDDLAVKGGALWAYVYDAGRPDLDELARRAHAMYLTPNGLDPTAFPSLLRLETDLAAMAAAHLGGDERVVGNFTSGGTESIILAVKAARDRAMARNPALGRPEMVVPATAHAAFFKAAHYLGLRVVSVPVDEQSFKADVAAMARAITPATIMLVGSAVSYAHGVCDPIPELGQLALERDLWLHVDGCIGGFLLPYFRRLGQEATPFDFSVPGVSSISMDWHKYAYCPKGASIICYKNKDLRRHQIFACAQWPGYAVVNNAVQSSKSGGPMAAAWAVLNHIGDDGYLALADQTLRATRRIIEGARAIDGLAILGRPELCLVAIAAPRINVFEIIDEMKTRGWSLQPQFRFASSPENIHLSVSAASLARVDDLLADLADCARLAAEKGPPDWPALARGLAGLDAASLRPQDVAAMLSAAGLGGAGLPRRMAGVNGLLNVMTPALREVLLREYFNELFVQPPQSPGAPS